MTLIIMLIPVVLGYLIGSIPFGVLTGKIRGIDIRNVGSGNIGATNTYRAMGTLPAIAVLMLDLLKGTAAVYIAQLLFPLSYLIIILSGLAAVLGHMYPIFLCFKGGKGSATSLGVLLGISPLLFCIAIVYAVLAVAVTRYVSVTSITGVILLSILMFAFHEPIEYALATVVITCLVIYKHVPNIQRLMKGTEPKIWGNK